MIMFIIRLTNEGSFGRLTKNYGNDFPRKKPYSDLIWLDLQRIFIN